LGDLKAAEGLSDQSGQLMSLDPTGKGRKRWSQRWKAALNAFEITFDGRLSAARR
jgi:putative transposase